MMEFRLYMSTGLNEYLQVGSNQGLKGSEFRVAIKDVGILGS